MEIELGPTSATGVHFPISEFFALALLHEAATQTIYSRPGRVWRDRPAAPIADELTFDDVIDMSSIETPDPRKAALTSRFVARAAYVATRNFAPRLWTVDATGSFRDPRISPRDPRAIAASRVLQGIYDAVSDNDAEALAPHATLRIEVTDAAWCAHLEVGMLWDVYAFDYAAEMLA